MVKATVGHQRNTVSEGKSAIAGSDCKACHAVDEKVNGPSYTDIAKRYGKDDTGYLVSKIIKGGGGVWGESAMSAHPQLNVDEVALMVDYMLSLKPKSQKQLKSLPLEGTLTFDQHLNSKSEGTYILMASYRDKGNPDQPDSQLTANEQFMFNSQKIQAENANEISEGINTWSTNYSRVVGSLVHNSYLRFDNLDLKNLKGLEYATFYNSDYDFKGILEIRQGALDGPIIGKQALSYKGKEKTKYYEIPVKPLVEKGTLYLVFKNPKNKLHSIGHADWISFNYLR